MLLDIHSHILPAVDDGAENLNEALKILKMMQKQGITDVIATPHFYPSEDNLEDFKVSVNRAFKKLREFSLQRDLPNIYLGCELLYFSGISNSENLSQFCLNNSRFLLLELADICINESLFKDIIQIREKFGITPIIAHVERYCEIRKYKKLIRFICEQKIPVQINAGSVLMPSLDRVIKKLLKSDIYYVLASDAHSTELRPPHIAQALQYIASVYGETYRSRLIANSEKLYKEIISGGE